ncbi:MAG: right-handed parallel beta-helix repeat-containing protein [Lentimicrobium sp.]
MKRKKFTRFYAVAVFCILFISTAQSQVQLQGLINQNEGSAAWNADGSGPEPFGSGHDGYLYYAATRDYVDPECAYGAHATGIGADYPAFAQALADNDFTPQLVKCRMGLASQGADLQGADWFSFGGNEDYMNFYPINITLYLDGEPMIHGIANYMVFHTGPSTGYEFECESNYFLPYDASGFSSPAVQAVAAAFMQDVGDEEIRLILNTFGTSQDFSGNGRSGAYFNINGSIETGRPQLPYQGLAVNHEGFAGWDADGTGPEPKRNGHDTQLYYIASMDYDDIDPDPAACFARLLSENGSGFQNFALQLEYRGFSPEQVKFKMDIRDLGEDIRGEDWYFEENIHCVNFYHSLITTRINDELLFGFVCDTATSYQNVAIPSLGWWGPSATTLVFDASAGSSDAVQAVAASFFKDMENRQIQTNTIKATQASGTISSNGRSGGFWEINEAEMVAVPPEGTQVQPGEVSGHWTMAGHPYIVTGDIIIPNGDTLVIDPGVWVKFSDRITFKVEGAIQAVGDTSNAGSIIFTAVNPELGWGHFVFDSTAITNEASVFSHCIFEYGYAPEAVPWSEPTNCGGAIAMREYDNVIIENCLFHHNRALIDAYWVAGGGAIGLWNSSPVIRNCVFSNNSANWSGAISCTFGSSPDIVNCLFYGNRSLKSILDGGGAILAGADANPRLLNNTFVNNHSNFRGGALEIFNGSNPDLINNVFWGNTAPANSQIYISSNDCNVDLKYNDIEGGEAGIGPYGLGTGVYENNLEVDPGFADALALNFQLAEGSPCIDAGIPDVTGLYLPPDDLLGNVRIWDGGSGVERIDIGPYEFNAPVYVGIHNPGTLQNSKFQVQCFPNPFSDFTAFSIDLPEPALVTLQIYNLTGGLVDELHNSRLPAGNHRLMYNAGNLPDGLYFLSIKTGTESTAIKLIRN